MSRSALFGKASLLLVLLLSLVWPALYNGQPIFFADTTAYIRGADAGISKVTGHASVWGASARLQTAEPARAQTQDFVIAGRSVYYGALLYTGDALDRLWPTVFIQAAIALLVLALTFQNFGVFGWKGF